VPAGLLEACRERDVGRVCEPWVRHCHQGLGCPWRTQDEACCGGGLWATSGAPCVRPNLPADLLLKFTL